MITKRLHEILGNKDVNLTVDELAQVIDELKEKSINEQFAI